MRAVASDAGDVAPVRDDCEVRRCRRRADLVYLQKGICSMHWNELATNDGDNDAVRKALGIAAPGRRSDGSASV